MQVKRTTEHRKPKETKPKDELDSYVIGSGGGVLEIVALFIVYR